MFSHIFFIRIAKKKKKSRMWPKFKFALKRQASIHRLRLRLGRVFPGTPRNRLVKDSVTDFSPSMAKALPYCEMSASTTRRARSLVNYCVDDQGESSSPFREEAALQQPLHLPPRSLVIERFNS